MELVGKKWQDLRLPNEFEFTRVVDVQVHEVRRTDGTVGISQPVVQFVEKICGLLGEPLASQPDPEQFFDGWQSRRKDPGGLFARVLIS